VLSPFALFGGLITICALSTVGDVKFTGSWIFEGEAPNQMYFMMHYIMVIIGTLVLVSTPRFKTYYFFKKNVIWQKLNITHWIFCFCFAALYYSYVAICMSALNVSQNVSGLNMNDWAWGEYNGVAQALNSSPQVACALGFIASIISISLLIFGFSYLQEIKRYHIDDVWNKKSWWFKQTYIMHSINKKK
jgi:hypothetical protein